MPPPRLPLPVDADCSATLRPDVPSCGPRELLAREGARALFRGWLPTYFRLGPHAILTFPLLEQMRRALGLENL